MKKSTRMKNLITKMATKRGVNLAEPEARFKAESSGFMDLVVECIGVNQVSVAHYYEQNGDLLQDPEIVFLVGCDGEWYPIEWTTPAVMFGGREYGGYRRYVEIDEKRGTWVRANLRGQAELASFANQWATNLRAQGFN